MKLRGRFTLTLALAALVPIGVAAVVTTRVIAASYRADYEANRHEAEVTVNAKLADLKRSVTETAKALSNRQHYFGGTILLDLPKSHGNPDKETRDRWAQMAAPLMTALALDIITVTGRNGDIFVEPQHHTKVFDTNTNVVKRADLAGDAYFTREEIFVGAAPETVLVAEAARNSEKEQGYSVSLVVGKRLTEDVLASVRRSGRVDARLVSADGKTEIEGKEWKQLAKTAPIPIGLKDENGIEIARIEIAVWDGGLDAVLRDVTITSAALAVGALAVVVLIGLFVSRRTASDLDRLVEGSIAAARGDLDHRVAVRSKDEVGAVANAFNLMMEDLKTSKERLVIAERIAAWQEIARRLAHEIKNPLTPIQMAMDTLKKSWKKKHPSFDEILEESTTTVLQEADRLKHIVAEFSDFARMPKPEFGRIDLNEVVKSSLALYQGAAPLEIKLDPSIGEIDADKDQLNQVLLNLVENSRDAIGAREGGKITVSTRRGEANDRALLVVEDNGPGVPADLKDKVFAPYFTTKHAKGGTGLGLAIVHRIVSDHGGRITISEAPGGGARFSIELPLRNGTALLASRI
ncbi:MAG: integral rane sensor signal transduction histidine kinase [Myxococcales bacterium]|nr:integral rane sensor signal transduction histidine kinase [Myxococcales bacterium]